MSRKCCVASSMSMLAQEAMGPTASVPFVQRLLRCCSALSSRAQLRQGQTAARGSLHSVPPKPVNRPSHRVPVPRQPHQPPSLPAHKSLGSRNPRGKEKKGSGLGAEASPLPFCVSAPLRRGPGKLCRAEAKEMAPSQALLTSRYPTRPQDHPRGMNSLWVYDQSTPPPRLGYLKNKINWQGSQFPLGKWVSVNRGRISVKSYGPGNCKGSGYGTFTNINYLRCPSIPLLGPALSGQKKETSLQTPLYCRHFRHRYMEEAVLQILYRVV